MRLLVDLLDDPDASAASIPRAKAISAASRLRARR
jgi:hypothetical protein